VSTAVLLALGRVIRDRRLALGLRQQDVAERCGFDRAYLSAIEWGKRNPTLLTVVAVAGALGCRASELLAKAGL
jgi:transcriptional regulator with XRE-family HTH domain